MIANPKRVLDIQGQVYDKARVSAKLRKDIILLQEKSGWSVRQMADFMDIPSSTLGSWRAGHIPKNLKVYLLLIFWSEKLS